MNKLLYLILTTLLLASCSTKNGGDNSVNLTDNEEKGIKEILTFYGGDCSYHVGVADSAQGVVKKYIELKLSKSGYLSKDSETAHIQASNLAYLFYKNLKTERNNYSEIRSSLMYPDQEKRSYKYPVKLLEHAENRINLATKIVTLLREKKFTPIGEMLFPSKDSIQAQTSFSANLKDVESKLGRITQDFIPFGFYVYRNAYGMQILHITGVIQRDKDNTNFSLDMDPNSTKDEIYMLRYSK